MPDKICLSLKSTGDKLSKIICSRYLWILWRRSKKWDRQIWLTYFNIYFSFLALKPVTALFIRVLFLAALCLFIMRIKNRASTSSAVCADNRCVSRCHQQGEIWKPSLVWDVHTNFIRLQSGWVQEGHPPWKCDLWSSHRYWTKQNKLWVIPVRLRRSRPVSTYKESLSQFHLGKAFWSKMAFIIGIH